MIIDDWKGMYPSAWKGIITPESFCHPAKVSSRLAANIYKHAIAEGWLHEGSRCVDPFGGIGGFAFHAMLNGMDMTLVELEPKFVALAQANIDAWNAKYSGRLARWGTARILQGDSRHLAQVIGAAEACISSPPFIDVGMDTNKNNGVAVGRNRQVVRRNRPENIGRGEIAREITYGSTPGNLGNLPPGNVDAVISSPPFHDQLPSHDNFIAPHDSQQRGAVDYDTAYGTTPGQLAALPPGAPPFEGCVSSPPFEESVQIIDNVKAQKYQAWAKNPDGSNRLSKSTLGDGYGSSSGQLGNDSGDTFWSAAREIVAQVYAVLAPGAHAIWVVKSYVKNKQLVDFPHQWQQLCEACGFVTLHEHHALLVRHGATSIDIDGNHHEKKTESKSFFRRLAEKNGSPRIDYETVLCLVKPGGEGGGWDGAISSPPYEESNQDYANGLKYIDRSKSVRKGGDHYEQSTYGNSPGQLGALPPGSLDDALSGE